MIVLVARFQARAGQGGTVAGLLRQMAPLVREHEPGCAMYQVCRATEDADAFLLYEHYVDEAALQAHRETPHFKEIIEGKIIPILDRREREFYELIIG